MMKNYLWLCCTVVSFLSLQGLAQDNANAMAMSESTAENNLTIVSYHVVETIKKPMGSSITTYDVPSLTMINSNDLGPNNTRVITPKYVRTKTVTKSNTPPLPVTETVTTTKALNAKDLAAKQEADKVEAAITEVVKEEINKAEANKALVAKAVLANPIETTKTEEPKIIPKKKEPTVNIDIIETYERVLDKGYKSVDMLKKVADRHFFKDELVVAAKWYGQLFEMTTDFESIYYYRYAKSLEAINEPEKAAQMMAVFKSKNY